MRSAICTAAGSLLLAASCASYDVRTAEFRAYYHEGEFAEAELVIDGLLGEPSEIDPSSGDTHLYFLEKAMTRLGQGDAGGATALLREARDQLEARSSMGWSEYVGTLLLDDTAIDYSGHDYELILVRGVLAITDLLAGGGDAYAYALQVGEKQEEIIGSEFGAELGYKPQENYRRVGLGAYLQGVIKEGALEPDEARIAYARAREFSGASTVVDDAIARVDGAEPFAPDGHGILHVFYFGGRGPFLGESVDEATEFATALASLLIAFMEDTYAPLVQDAVPVPEVVVSDGFVVPLTVAAEGFGELGATETLLDVNQVAIEQLDANMPLIFARALVRRTIKGVASAEIAEEDELLGALFGAIATGLESADTRCWSSLPAQIQVARFPLPEGEHGLLFGGDTPADVAITRGRDSYVLVLRPNQAQPGVALVDRFSEPAPLQP